MRRLGAERRALPDEVIATLGPRIERRARHGEDQPPLLVGEAGGDQRAAVERRLHHQHALRQAGDDAVAAREIVRQWWGAECKFTHDRAAGGNLACQRGIVGRVNAIDAGTDDGDRTRALHFSWRVASQCATVGGGVDAGCQTADDGETLAGEMAGEGFGVGFTVRA